MLHYIKMVPFSRRQWLAGLAGATLGRAQKPPVAITDYHPKSMLHVRETIVPRSRYPVIDIHTHLTWVDTLLKVPKIVNNSSPEEILPVMDRKNIRMMVNLTGGSRPAPAERGPEWHTPHPRGCAGRAPTSHRRGLGRRASNM